MCVSISIKAVCLVNTCLENLKCSKTRNVLIWILQNLNFPVSMEKRPRCKLCQFKFGFDAERGILSSVKKARC